jgi:hypothetical protein
LKDLFEVGRASAQTFMKAIGEIQPVGGTHFVYRASLLLFLDAMREAPEFEEAFRAACGKPMPRRKPGRLEWPCHSTCVASCCVISPKYRALARKA